MRKLIALLITLTLLMPGAALAGIGSPDARVTVTCLRKGTDANDPDTKLIAQAIEDALDARGVYVDLEFISTPDGEYTVEVPKRIVSGKLAPDMVYFENDCDIDCVMADIPDNLMPFIDESSSVKGLLEPHSWERLTSWPYLLWLSPAGTEVPVMRADVLAKAASGSELTGEPSPETYLSVLKELKDAGAIEYGFAISDLSELDTIFNHAFGVTATLMRDGDAIVYGCSTDAERDKLEFYARLYAEGLISDDYASATRETALADFRAGKAAIIVEKSGTAIDALDAGTLLTVLPPAGGVSRAYKSVDVSKESCGFALNSYSDVKDAAFAVLEYMASPEGRMLDMFGVAGVHYELDSDGPRLLSAHDDYWPRFFPTVSGLPDAGYASTLMSKAALSSLSFAQRYYAPDTSQIIPDELRDAYNGAMGEYASFAADMVGGDKFVSDWPDFHARFNEAGGAALSDYATSRLG